MKPADLNGRSAAIRVHDSPDLWAIVSYTTVRRLALRVGWHRLEAELAPDGKTLRIRVIAPPMAL